MNVFTKECIFLNTNYESRDQLLQAVGEELLKQNRIEDIDTMQKEVMDREAQMSTYMGEGIAIPHCKSDNVLSSTVVLVRNKETIAWNEESEQTNLIFLLCVGGSQKGQLHLKILAKLASNLMDEDFIETMKQEENLDVLFGKLQTIEQDLEE